MLRELVGKEGANVSNICFMLRLRIVRGEPVIIVEKRATSRENTLKVLRAVRPLVGVGKPATLVGKQATSGENALEVLRAVKPVVGVGGELLHEVTED